jgi:hypothetical protein
VRAIPFPRAITPNATFGVLPGIRRMNAAIIPFPPFRFDLCRSDDQKNLKKRP